MPSITQSRPVRRHGLSVVERIERYRVVRNGCWETRLDLEHVYPQMKIGGRKIMIHRAAYEAYKKPIPDRLMVLHSCDNPRCHRPSHLFLGDSFTNMQDMVRKGRAAKRKREAVIPELAIALGRVLTQTEVAECFGVTQTTVSVALRLAGASRGKTTSFGKNHGRGGRRGSK